MRKNSVVCLVIDFTLTIMKVKQRSEGSQRFYFNSSEVKQRSESRQIFHFNNSEVQQRSEGSQSFQFNSIERKTV